MHYDRRSHHVMHWHSEHINKATIMHYDNILVHEKYDL